MSQPTAATVHGVDMQQLPGFRNQLNDLIESRVDFLAKEVGLPHLKEKYAYLKTPSESWRKLPTLPDDADLSAYIDQTVLKPEASDAAVEQLCEQAVQHHFKAVCVNGCYVARCAERLANSGVLVASVAGFPLGQTTRTMKAAESAEAIALGAKEIDMVLNVGALKSKRYRDVFEDVKAVRDVCAPAHVICKVILETCLLTTEEIVDACILSVAAEADFVKTSTGFCTGGATPEALDIMLAAVGPHALVKASGGVRDRAVALRYVRAGVSRIGTSNGVAMMSERQ